MKEKKMRNLQNEVRYSFFVDFAILFVTALFYALTGDSISKVGDRNVVAFGLLYALVVISLMYFFEKYTVAISGNHEKAVIAILSSLYAFVLFALVDLVLFASMELFIRLCIASTVSALLLVFGNIIQGKYFLSPKRYRKPRLLIIDSNDRNFHRMKRIKYGVVQNYDAWYERIETHEDGYMEKFVEDRFPKFDSVCILDGLNDHEYETAIKKAMELNKEIFVAPKL